MYITVMDYSTSTITKLVWDVEDTESACVEMLLELMGYHLSQISYMVTEDEPDFGGIVEVTDVLNDAELSSCVNSTKTIKTILTL